MCENAHKCHNSSALKTVHFEGILFYVAQICSLLLGRCNSLLHQMMACVLCGEFCHMLRSLGEDIAKEQSRLPY